MWITLQTSWLRLEDYLSDGGIVMVPLVVVSMVMWVLVLERVIHFRRLYRKNMNARTAWDHIRSNRFPHAAQYKGVVSILVKEFLHNRSGRRELDCFILDEIVQRLQRRLRNYLAVIGVLAAVAPLLGLLGTVTGMIATFDVLTYFGTGNAKAMAGGISEALITTQTGLLVAIPGLYMKGFLDRRADNLARQLQRVGFYLRRQI